MLRFWQAKAPAPPITAAVLLMCCAIPGAAQVRTAGAMALQQTRYEVRAGESTQIAAPPETLEFLLKAKNRRLDIQGNETQRLVAGPNRAGDRILLAAPLRTEPGEYTVRLSAMSAAGEERATTLALVVKPRQTVPSSAIRPPVVLLNGWELGFTGTCPIATSSSDTFGNLASYLVTDGVPDVFLFDNCVEDPGGAIETLGNDLGVFLTSIKYASGAQVPQIDLVAHSMGGLIARAYLAGLQQDGTLTPPTPTLVRDLVLIAVPNFGSFIAGLYVNAIEAGTQSAELVPASSFLWNLATWNQFADDVRGVDTLAIAGNAGNWLANLSSSTALTNASDGLVSLTSASGGFIAQSSPQTIIVPYCHVDPVDFTSATFGSFLCNAPGIANVTDTSQLTGQIVRFFLSGTSAWQTITGTETVANNPYLSANGGMFFAVVDSADQYLTDLSQVTFGTLGTATPVALLNGGDTDTVFYDDFIYGTGEFLASSASQGTVDCGQFVEPLGYYSAARCKLSTVIFDEGGYPVGPLGAGRFVYSGSTITINGANFEQQCNGCKVTAISTGAAQQTTLQVSSWTNTAISVDLPAAFTGLVTLIVQAVSASDSINIMAVPPVVNGASYQPSFAPATWVAIFGTNLAQTTRLWQTSDFVNGALPTSLDGVSVTIDGIPAYVEYISPTQINVLAPDDDTVGPVAVVVNGTTFQVQKQQFAPAFFTFSGTNYLAAEHANYSLVGKTGLITGVTTTPAAPGETILLYGTGFGPTSPATPTGNLVTAPATLANTPQITIGGEVAKVAFAGLVEAGLYQFNVTVPSDLPSGDAAVVATTVGGTQSQLGVSITVQQPTQ
ncbi:MAG: IPT/TIG domain-containing protein [Bryobacteraceae bacterium]